MEKVEDGKVSLEERSVDAIMSDNLNSMYFRIKDFLKNGDSHEKEYFAELKAHHWVFDALKIVFIRA